MPSTKFEVNKRARDKWYKLNKAKQLRRQKKRRKELMLWLEDYKKTLQCKKCGFDFNQYPECLDFHHIDPKEKKGVVKELVHYSKHSAELEIAKCIPLCANCHRIIHRRSAGR